MKTKLINDELHKHKCNFDYKTELDCSCYDNEKDAEQLEFANAMRKLAQLDNLSKQTELN